MPTFFDPASFDKSGPEDVLQGDENKQIEVLRNYFLTLSAKHPAVDARPQSPKSTGPLKPAEAEAMPQTETQTTKPSLSVTQPE